MDTANQFFALLYKDVPEQYIAELRFIPEGGGIPERMYRPANYMEHGNFEALHAKNKTFHIYHRIALSLTNKSRKQDIALVTALWVDIDAKSDELIEKLETHHYPPTMLIDSGRGLHAYWLLKNPVELANDTQRFEFERTIQGMILDFGESSADKAVKDCTRILRTPFFANIKAKYAPSFPMCRVLWADDSIGDRYHFHHLYRRYAPLGTPQAPQIRRELPVLSSGKRPKWIEDWLATGSPQGERNKRLYDVSRALWDIGLSELEISSEVSPRALADGLSQSEIITTIRSACANARNPATALDSTMKSRYAMGDVARKAKKE